MMDPIAFFHELGPAASFITFLLGGAALLICISNREKLSELKANFHNYTPMIITSQNTSLLQAEIKALEEKCATRQELQALHDDIRELSKAFSVGLGKVNGNLLTLSSEVGRISGVQSEVRRISGVQSVVIDDETDEDEPKPHKQKGKGKSA